MFDIAHTPVAVTIAHMAELIDTVTAKNHRALGEVTDDITPFHSRAIPNISVHDYLERVAKFVCLENDSLLAVLVYIDRITRAQLHRPSLAPSPFNIHRLVITAIVIAHKFNSDIFFNNARYSKVGGIPLGEMNQLELEMLFLVKFDLKVDVAELQHLGAWLVTQSRPHLFRQAPLCLLAQYHEDGTHRQQFPTPALDPAPGAQHGAVPHLDLAPYELHRRAEPQPAYNDQPLRHSAHVTQPRAHGPHCKQSAHTAAELTTPSSLGTAYQPSTPRNPADHEHVSEPGDRSRAAARLSSDSVLMLPTSPAHLASDSTLVQKRRRLRTSGIYAARNPANIGCSP
ncbi:cyclin-like protein interacting with PHO85 [Coemansia sp. RSA 2610]|nr:cyclin-like protein interacting with PHO85 [Coemansia sp. RSA 2610]